MVSVEHDNIENLDLFSVTVIFIKTGTWQPCPTEAGDRSKSYEAAIICRENTKCNLIYESSGSAMLTLNCLSGFCPFSSITSLPPTLQRLEAAPDRATDVGAARRKSALCTVSVRTSAKTRSCSASRDIRASSSATPTERRMSAKTPKWTGKGPRI